MQLRLMDRLATVTVAVFVCLLAAVRTETRIRGCNDIEDLQNEAANFTEFCFCKANVLTKTVALFCTYGSDSLQLVNALDAINVSDFTLTQLSISHLKWENSQLSKKLALKMGSKLEEIVVGQCGSHGLSIDVDAFDHLSDSLSTLSVYDCGLKSIPDAVKPLSAIRKLSFPDNLINSINAAPLKNKKNLIYLNLEGNFINHAEEDAFEGVDSLRTLLIGEHNYANETLLGEIQKLRGLEILDMTKMDGVVSIDVRQFKGNENLQTLILNGCSLKSIGNESFAGLRNLKQMDLRLNLLETVANESFVDAEKLERLSLEGNFLKTINASMWNGLKRLETLDLGWNELVNLTSGAFAPIGKALKNLKLSNNAKLSLIEGNAFESLMELRVLNVSSCRVREITATHLRPLAALDTLDLSHNELLRVGPEAFKEQRKTLKVLKLNDNLLRGFDGAIVDSLEELESIDLSDNPWLCDKQIYSLISAIENKYKLAFEEKKDFLLENANNTFCSRPYKLRFKSLFELLEEELEEYNEKMDTTTPPTTTATSNETEGTVETTPIFDLALLVGDTSSNKSILREDIRKMPEFDINERWADDFKSESERTWIQFAMVGSIVLITVAILATVVLHLKKKRLAENAREAESSTVKMSEMESGMEKEQKQTS